MKKLTWIFALALVASASAQVIRNSPAPSPYATTDPLLVIYRVSGVFDSGDSDGAGIATIFHCSNTSSVQEKLQIQVRQFNGTVLATKDFFMGANRTLTLVTHAGSFFGTDGYLTPTIKVDQGFARISSTARGTYCSAMIIDAAAFVPEGISLHMVRSNAPTGVQE